MKILIVEDDKILSDTIKQCIIKDYEVEQAYDGYDGYILSKEDILTFQEMKLNLKNRKVTIEGEEIPLQGKQFDLLEYLLYSKNTIITKEQIFEKIWGFDSDTTTNVVEVYASGLRKILKKYHYDKYVKTIRGVGYMLEDKKDSK